MHVLATTYYHDAKSNKPSQHSVHFPAQKITITYAGNTIVADVANFLQNSERRLMREEYFENRMGIVPIALEQIDQYALARIIQKNPQYRLSYTKIIHKELNTMQVNRRWNLGSDICPLCLKEVEDWKHITLCTHEAMINEKKGHC